MGAENGTDVEPHVVAETLSRALAKAFPGRAEAIQLVVEPRLWAARGSHPARSGRWLGGGHCVCCGRESELLAKVVCARCVVVLRAISRSRIRRTKTPDAEMAVALAARALRAAHEERAAEVVEGVAAPAPPSDERACSRCGPFRGWPRDADEGERCAACVRVVPEVPALVAGPFRALCVFCLERLLRGIPAARRRLVPKVK